MMSGMQQEQQGDVPWGTQWDLARAADPILGAWSPGRVTLGFQDGRAGGRGPVNRYFGICHQEAAGLRMGPFGMTMMAGPPEAMAAETAFHRLLEQVVGLRHSEAELVLLDAEGGELMAFVPSADPT